MAWKIVGSDLYMAEEDFGVVLPTTFDGATLTANDTLQFVFKKQKNGEEILTKTFSAIEDNQFNFVLTREDSALFPVGSYVFRVDWLQDGNFMCNIVECANLRIGDKA